MKEELFRPGIYQSLQERESLVNHSACHYTTVQKRRFIARIEIYVQILPVLVHSVFSYLSVSMFQLCD